MALLREPSTHTCVHVCAQNVHCAQVCLCMPVCALCAYVHVHTRVCLCVCVHVCAYMFGPVKCEEDGGKTQGRQVRTGEA